MTDKIHDKDIVDVGNLTIGGGGKGYEFKLKSLPETYEEFRDFMNHFQEAFGVSWTLREEAFKNFPSKYIDQSTVKEVNNVF